MKKVLIALMLISAISLTGCWSKNTKSVFKTPDGRTVTTVVSPEGHMIRRTVR